MVSAGVLAVAGTANKDSAAAVAADAVAGHAHLAGLRLSPVLAAAAMALSSLSVMGNANWPRHYRTTPRSAGGRAGAGT